MRIFWRNRCPKSVFSTFFKSSPMNAYVLVFLSYTYPNWAIFLLIVRVLIAYCSASCFLVIRPFPIPLIASFTSILNATPSHFRCDNAIIMWIIEKYYYFTLLVQISIKTNKKFQRIIRVYIKCKAYPNPNAEQPCFCIKKEQMWLKNKQIWLKN